jgi:hypothetical protein
MAGARAKQATAPFTMPAHGASSLRMVHGYRPHGDVVFDKPIKNKGLVDCRQVGT